MSEAPNSTAEADTRCLNERRAAFQRRLTELFETCLAKGLSASEAAALALRIESGAVTAPVHLTPIHSLAAHKDNGTDDAQAAPSREEQQAVRTVETLFSSPSTLVLSHATSVASGNSDGDAETRLQLDWDAIDKTAASLSGSHGTAVMAAAVAAAQQMARRSSSGADMLHSLAADDSAAPSWMAAQAVATLACMPWLGDPEHEELLVALSGVVTAWPSAHQRLLVEALSRLPRRHMNDLVSSKLLQFIVLRLVATAVLDSSVMAAVEFLGLAFQANEQGGQLPRTQFQCDAINQETFDLKGDYVRWRQRRFSFCAHPYMYDAASKAEILRIENQSAMSEEFHDAVIMHMAGWGASPYLVLKVRRDHLLSDTVIQMQRAQHHFRKPLRVKFIGEEGVDEGGVTKEFFQLLTAQLLNPDYGMFLLEPETRQLWFRPTQIQPLQEFTLVGNLIGLAMYNSVLIEAAFPMELYK